MNPASRDASNQPSVAPSGTITGGGPDMTCCSPPLPLPPGWPVRWRPRRLRRPRRLPPCWLLSFWCCRGPLLLLFWFIGPPSNRGACGGGADSPPFDGMLSPLTSPDGAAEGGGPASVAGGVCSAGGSDGSRYGSASL